MSPKFTISLLLLLCPGFILSQELLKDIALEQFKNEHYHEAIATLTDALKVTPNDADIYYYRGFFNHYIGSDSRLYEGYNKNFTEEILADLDKSIELKPNYGDAKYFYGAECATQAFAGMQNRDLTSIQYYLTRAYKKGAFPKWLVEFGKNMLNNCDQDAILFVAGDADLNVILYLQVIEKIRSDITVMPIANIDRPWYLQFVKEGMEGVLRKVEISLSEQQIMQIRPFKWKPTSINIPVKDSEKTKYNLSEDFKMQWLVEPDLKSERMHSKIEGEDAQQRTYLSPQRANLLQIVEDNYNLRPIFFSNFANPTMYGGLNDYFEDYGLVSKLVPIKTEGTEYNLNTEALERLLIKENIKDFRTIKTDNIPRIYRMMYIYPYLVKNIGQIYMDNDQSEKTNNLIKLYKEKIMIGLDNELENYVLNGLVGK